MKSLKFFIVLSLNFFLTTSVFSQIAPIYLGGGIGGGSECKICDKYNSYKVTTGFLSLMNGYINIRNLQGYYKNYPSSGFGIFTGSCQIIIGMMYADECPENDRSLFESINIASGSITILIETLRLVKKKPPVSNTTSWNLFYMPVDNNKPSIGITLTKKI